MRWLEYCEKHQIAVADFPPHSTHRLQPLNVSLFFPLSQFYSQELNSYKIENEGLRNTIIN